MKTSSQWFSSWPEQIRADLLENYQRVFSALARQGGFNDADANDIAQKTIASMARNGHKFDVAQDVWKWSYHFCKNAMRDARKSRKAKKNSARSINDLEIATKMHKALQEAADLRSTLEKAEYELFGDSEALGAAKQGARLVIFYDQRPVDVAKSLGTTESSINSETTRMRTKLRAILLSEFGGPTKRARK